MAKNIRRELDRLRLPELQERFREVIGEETRCPNRTFLIRRITEAIAARAATSAEAEPAEPAPSPNVAPTFARAARARTASPGKPTSASPRTDRPQRGRFKSMTIDELQTAYLSIVGRPTGSTDRRYLIWKIREAEKGRVPIGPRATRTPGQEAQSDVKILPLRIGTEAVEKIDAVWRNAGMPSRMEFFRRALGHFLKHLGQRDAAALFA